MDAFYASVEQRDNPEIRGKPVAVGGNSRRGVVCAASYEARVFGVRSAMSGITASRLCPHLIFVRPRFEAYREVSLQIREIFNEYTDLVQPLSLDEAYLDVTENKFNNPSATLIAHEIRQKIFEKTHLTASAGVSYNKFLAKVASDVNKPNGIKVILPTEAEAFLNTLPIGKFYGIGRVTAKKFEQIGVLTGADLRTMQKPDLVNRFGKAGAWYYHIVRGEDTRTVDPSNIRKSIGAEETFTEDLDDLDTLAAELSVLVRRVFDYMQRKNNFGRTISLKIKSSDFKLATRARSFLHEVDDFEVFHAAALGLLEQHYTIFPKIRLLGISVSNLQGDAQGGGTAGIQLELDLV